MGFAVTRMIWFGLALALSASPAVLRHAAAQSWGKGDPFSLGVASGAPRSDGFVLWTRLAPQPSSSDPETPAGMSGGRRVPVVSHGAVSSGVGRMGRAVSRRSPPAGVSCL